MKKYLFRWAALFSLICISTGKATDQEQDRAEIEKSIASYVEGFNARNAEKLAAHWSPDGVYVSPSTGEQISGRDALAKEFAANFAEDDKAQLEVNTESIDFISPNVALERGSATVRRPDEPPVVSTYSVVHIRREGKWLIDRITEDEVVEPPSHYEQLKGLEWLIGTWVDQAGGDVIKTEVQWTRNQNFITRSFTVSHDAGVDMAGMQVIGWDAAQKQIRSWLFDSDGGFADGIWEQKNDHWIVRTKATLADGGQGSFTSLLRPVDENSFSWRKVNQIVDGELLPNLEEIIIVREGSQE